MALKEILWYKIQIPPEVVATLNPPQPDLSDPEEARLEATARRLREQARIFNSSEALEERRKLALLTINTGRAKGNGDLPALPPQQELSEQDLFIFFSKMIPRQF